MSDDDADTPDTSESPDIPESPDSGSEAQSDPTPVRNGSRLKAIGVLVGVFVLGVVAGGAGEHARLVRHWRDTMQAPPATARARFRLESMQRHLDLTDQQRDKLETILAESAEERDKLTDECRPALDELRERTDARIREVLTPEQQAKHEEMMKRMRERRGKRGGGDMRGPRRGPPGRRGPRPGGPPGD